MNKNKTISALILKFMLLRGKNKRIGLIAKILIRIKGHFDGKLELLRENDQGIWLSPFVDYEINGLHKFTEKAWGYFQITVTNSLSELRLLMDTITKLHLQIDEVNHEIEIRSAENKPDYSRKAGEEQIADYLVAARRNREFEKLMSPLKRRKEHLIEELNNAMDEAIRLRSILYENSNSVRSICDSQKERVRQCVDVYWKAVLITHPKTDEIPAIPAITFGNKAEDSYYRFHSFLDSEYSIPETVHSLIVSNGQPIEA